ncbi:MAG: beta-phosphoglucomutase [Treponema sp.]|nr:beta-phosphoglucomutase [Treponema sp.]
MIFTTKRFGGADTARNETLFTTGNGNIGFRGDTEEKAGTVHKGTYINGFFDSEPIQYGETAYGYAKNHETILNLPDVKRIELSVDGLRFDTTGKTGTVTDFALELDEKEGVMRRLTCWESAVSGKKRSVRLETVRLVSFSHQDCACIRYKVTNTSSESERISLASCIDTGAGNILAKDDPRIGAKFTHRPLVIDRTTAVAVTVTAPTASAASAASAASSSGFSGIPGTLGFDAHTEKSSLLLSCAVSHTLEAVFPDKPALPLSMRDVQCERPGLLEFADVLSEDASGSVPAIFLSRTLKAGESLILTKYIAFCTARAQDARPEEVRARAEKACADFSAGGFEKACQEQQAFLSDFWNIAGIRIEESSEEAESEKSSAQDALHFNLFHLLQSAGRSGSVSIAAKGLTSEGYEGHFFWDTESYVCPVFTYTAPYVAEKLLEYRASILDKARARASVMGLKGALYPWRTISGEETSAYFPAGTAQYHINADIVYALVRYLSAHDGFASDLEPAFPLETARLMLAESARMYYSLGHYNARRDGAFCIDDVTGPDEYTAIVNNNAFTNLMVRETFELAANLCGQEATPEEKADWKKAACSMYIPFDKKEGVYPQDDSFMDKKEWDFANTPRSNYPLLLHYHPLVIYRHRVLKQPDLVLAQFLLSGRFSLAEKIRNFRFYEKYTTGDSSLSHCIMSIMACETGDTEKALLYFNKTVRMDIDDVNGNSRDGIHTACMAGSWMSVVYGFAGFRDYGASYSFNPRLPAGWKRLQFSLCLKGCVLDVALTEDCAEYSLRSKPAFAGNASLSLTHRNTAFSLQPGESRRFSLKKQLKAVLFDLDGVITNTAPLHYQAWKALCDEKGLRFTPEMNHRLLGISREASLEVILSENALPKPWSEAEKAAFCTQKNERYRELLTSLTENDILPGIRELLQALSERHIPCALASSSKNAPAILERLGIKKYFSAVADASRVQMAKPEPDLFLDAAEKAGVWPEDCVGVEDAAAGVAAIHAAGMKAVGITTSMALPQADLQLASTAELTYDKLLTLF